MCSLCAHVVPLHGRVTASASALCVSVVTVICTVGYCIVRRADSTAGHLCVSRDDLEEAKHAGSSLLYGEVLPRGVVRMFDAQHLRGADARVVVDLGMGTGKLCMQGARAF